MCLTIEDHPIVDYPARPVVPFTFDGSPMQAGEGLPIAAALLQNGINVFRHTEKSGRPRGLFCGIGQCNDCVVVVNGRPNVRSCVTPLEAGMAIETQDGYGRLVAEEVSPC